MFKCPEIWHIGASCPANECLHWVYLNMFSITYFFAISFEYRGFLWMRYQKYFIYLGQPMMVTNYTTLPSQITFWLKLKSFYLVHIVCTNMRWSKFDLRTRNSKNVKPFAYCLCFTPSCHEIYEIWDIGNDSKSCSQRWAAK